MEKTRSTKIIAIAALVVAIVGVSVGFAAWSSTLTISSAEATVKQGSNDAAFKEKLTITAVSCDETSGSASVENVGTFTSGYAWTGVKATLTKPNDSVTCTATVTNASDYDAYFENITIASQLSCSGIGQNVNNVCKLLRLTATGEGNSSNSATVLDTTITNQTDIEGNYIEAGEIGKLSFKLEYTGSEVSDSDFTVIIPTMTFDFSTVD